MRNIFIIGVSVGILTNIVANYLWELNLNQIIADPNRYYSTNSVHVWLTILAATLLLFVIVKFKEAQEKSYKKIGKNAYLISHIKEAADYRSFKRKRAAKK
ncbi:MAG: hypothetical protein HY394_01095 [Candidatus Diapherotrites archaeon]|nr:hypothetical protein [Candidatus Diapherotrites archaeon]